MRMKRLKLMSGDEAELLANCVLIKAQGRSIGMAGRFVGMAIWQDHKIVVLGQPACASTKASSGRLIEGSPMLLQIHLINMCLCLLAALGPDLFVDMSTQGGMTA